LRQAFEKTFSHAMALLRSGHLVSSTMTVSNLLQRENRRSVVRKGESHIDSVIKTDKNCSPKKWEKRQTHQVLKGICEIGEILNRTEKKRRIRKKDSLRPEGSKREPRTDMRRPAEDTATKVLVMITYQTSKSEQKLQMTSNRSKL